MDTEQRGSANRVEAVPLSATPFGTLLRGKKSTPNFEFFAFGEVSCPRAFSLAATRMRPPLVPIGLRTKDVIECQYHSVILYMVTKSREEAAEMWGNPDHLVQNNPDRYTPEQRREWASKAGKASAAKRYQKKLQRDILKDMLSAECDDDAAVEQLKALGLDASFANAANLAVLRRAVKGDVECMRYIRDTIGEKPTEAMQLGVYNTPVKALDLTKLSDQELEALADRTDAVMLEE